MDVRAVAEAFVAARRSGTSLDHYPGRELPDDLDQAYAIQDAAIGLWDDVPAGWKAGLIAPDVRESGGDDRLVGPIWQGSIHRADGAEIEMPIIADGFAALEAEFVVRVEVSVEPADWTPTSADALPHTIFAGIEVAGSPFAKINDLGPAVTASDFGNNVGLIVGAELSGLPESVMVRTAIDGDIVGAADGSVIPGGVLTSLAQTLNILGRRGLVVPPGTFFATGAITGVHQAAIGSFAEISFGDLDPLRCRLVARH